MIIAAIEKNKFTIIKISFLHFLISNPISLMLYFLQFQNSPPPEKREAASHVKSGATA